MLSSIDYITKLAKFTVKEKEQIKKLISYKQVSEGIYLVKQGEICRKLMFLQKGAAIMIYERGTRIFIKDFIFENSYASVYESLITQQPARYGLKAISDCVFESISYHDLQQLYQNIPQLNIIAKIQTEHIYLNMSHRFESIITLSAEERYLELLDRRPNLFLEVPLYLIASYLGITDVALSRIRNRLSKKNR